MSKIINFIVTRFLSLIKKKGDKIIFVIGFNNSITINKDEKNTHFHN